MGVKLVSLMSREEQTGVFESRMQGRVFGLNRVEKTA
jgi:hypothetical protein